MFQKPPVNKSLPGWQMPHLTPEFASTKPDPKIKYSYRFIGTATSHGPKSKFGEEVQWNINMPYY
jgi:hypothetical protein